MRRSILFFFFMLAMLSAPPSVVAQRRIVVGMFEETPLIFTDSKGHHRGIAVDLLDYIARQEKWTLQYLPGTRSQCVKRLKTGIVDLLPGLAELKKREKALQLGKESILTDWGQMYIHPDTPPAHLLDFTGRDIAFAEKDPYTPAFETMLTVLEIHPQMIKAADYKSVLSLVHQKKVSAGIVSRIYGAYGEKHFKVKRSPISFCPVKLCFAVLKDRNTDILITLDAYLKKLKATPRSIYHQSLKRWTTGVRPVTYPRWLKPLWVLCSIIAVMVIIVVGNVILSRQVKRRTEVLKNTIAEKEKIESELAVAREIQLQLVPDRSPSMPRRKEFDIFACLEPALEVGGDFYDYFFIDKNTLCLVIGDVSGKGVPAALFMAMAKTMLKSAARLLVEPEYILADVNREISRNNPSLTFVTVFLGVLDLNTGMLTYTSAGHNPPLFIGLKGNSVLLGDAQCPAIGLDETHGYRQATVQLQHKEGLLLYTDGVTEAQDSKNHMFTQEALMRTVSLTADLSPEKRVQAILSRVREFTGNRALDDDLTLLAMTYFSPDRVGETLKTIVVKNDIREMSRITDTITRITDAAGCPPVVVHDVILAVEEIFSNIVFYGFGDDLDHNITFHVVAETDALILTLQDEGIPFNPLNVHVGSRDKPLEERDKGGMGIILAKNLMDRMEYRRDRGKNIMRMEKHYR
ncbi:RsbU: predicted serine phosphatase, regulator of sigma subunit [Desulfosarcina variabilis str. Montpellier]|uniref:SpoIIE family protein phosphatase n=1 Tax=Desulfosarcina variabilis TaxID=2300 RepID=UPI003AFAAAD3